MFIIIKIFKNFLSQKSQQLDLNVRSFNCKFYLKFLINAKANGFQPTPQSKMGGKRKRHHD
jgi:hypothetical protein